MKSPCFDVKTKTDCPKRAVGCASTCEKWQQYIEKRNKEYKRRKVTGDVYVPKCMLQPRPKNWR